MKQKKELINCEIGDSVYLNCDSSFGSSSTGVCEIDKIDYKYDENTGEKFKIIKLFDNDDWYDTRSGNCFSNKNSMFYIETC